MKPFQVKAFLFRNRLNVSQMARELHEIYNPQMSFASLRVMLGDTLFGRRYFPRLAHLIESHYGIHIDRPASNRPTRTEFKKAA